MSTLSISDIEHLSRLARLNLTEEEKTRFAGQLSSVVQYVEHLSAVDTKGVGELRGVTGLTNVLAEDLPRAQNNLAQVSREHLLAGAPSVENNLFKVRAVLGGESGAA